MERAARELVARRRVHTQELVVALRDYVRHALQLEPIPADVAASIPFQGPTRPIGSGGGFYYAPQAAVSGRYS